MLDEKPVFTIRAPQHPIPAERTNPIGKDVTVNLELGSHGWGHSLIAYQDESLTDYVVFGGLSSKSSTVACRAELDSMFPAFDLRIKDTGGNPDQLLRFDPEYAVVPFAVERYTASTSPNLHSRLREFAKRLGPNVYDELCNDA
jgi:hypothetical protein